LLCVAVFGGGMTLQPSNIRGSEDNVLIMTTANFFAGIDKGSLAPPSTPCALPAALVYVCE